jgi:hypothetical protein
MVRLTILTVSGFLVLASAVSAAPDLNGVWWIEDRSETIPVAASKLPFTPAGRAEYDKNRAALAKGETLPIGAPNCFPPGVPRLMLARYPIEIFQRPEQITFIHEMNHMVRMIYMDEPQDAEPDPSFNGHSVGKWEGDALVVDSAAFKGKTILDPTGIPHSDALHIVERYTLAGKVLKDKVTVDDPKIFTRPWDFTLSFRKRPDIRLMEYACTYGPPARDLAEKKK